MPEKKITDKFGREVKYLRVSVTDRCNFRCKYCMPTNNFEYIPHKEILTFKEMLTAIEVFGELGVEKVRVTGGEPLVRKGIKGFLHSVNEIDQIKEVTLTTNGSLLEKFSEDIKSSGIRRINVSIDSLKKERYADITGGKFDLESIIDGIKHAQRTGIGPIKTNMVVIKGFNHDEILDFCEFSAKYKIITRFIEFMPVGNFSQWKEENIMYGDEILDVISKNYGMKEVKKQKLSGPARNYELSNGAMIGIITPISNHFCSECDKLRLTADGKIRPCLLSDAEVDLKEVIRQGSRDDLKQTIIKALNLKEREHTLVSEKRNEGYKRTMSKIGG